MQLPNISHRKYNNYGLRMGIIVIMTIIILHTNVYKSQGLTTKY